MGRQRCCLFSCAGFVLLLGCRRPLGQGLAPVFRQVFQQPSPVAAPQLEQHEGVFTEAIPHQEIHRADVFAGVGFVGAAALAAHLLQLEREQAFAAGGEGPFDVGGHDPRQQLGRPAGFLGQRFQHIAPVLIVEHVQPELHLVGRFIGALDAGMHAAAFEADRGHMAFAGVAPGPLQPFLEAVAVDQLHPLLDPPGLLAQAVVADGGDAVAAAVAEGHGQVSSKATRSRN